MALASVNPSSMAEVLKPMDTVKAGEPVGESSKDLSEVAMKVAQIDEAISKARASAPAQEDAEACEWHEVSIKAQMWTRSSLVEQQSNALTQLKSSAVSHESSADSTSHVDVLIFDVDDMMYPLSSGFSDHRNGEVICKFMMEKLDFASESEALELRNEYFRRYHSTMKGLGVATAEGRLPNPQKPFKEEELAQFWAENCDFAKYLKPDPRFIDALRSLRDDTQLTLVVFSNSPRPYVLQCLVHLGVRDFFKDEHIFGVQEVLPACKPEKAAFEKVLASIGCTHPERAVMFEDSMKNIRACHAMGIKTVLIDEKIHGGEAALLGDLPLPEDPAVGVVMNNPGQIRAVMPELWEKHSRFVKKELA